MRSCCNCHFDHVFCCMPFSRFWWCKRIIWNWILLTVRKKYLFLFLPPANEVCEGYVFTGVCLSTGGGCLSHCMLGYTPPGQTYPTRQTPPWADNPHPVYAGIHPLRSACWDTVNKRAVRIPLECILVLSLFLLQVNISGNINDVIDFENW